MRQEYLNESSILYTRGEDIFCMIMHIIGGAQGAAVTALLVTMAALRGHAYGVISGAICGAMMILYYCMSSIYHGLKPRLLAKKVFRILSMCAMFLLIAATYTTIALCTVREKNTAMGWLYFGILLGLALTGILFNAIAYDKSKIVTLILYLLGWWSWLAVLPFLYDRLGIIGILLLFFGALLYSLAALFFMLDQRHNGLHGISHILLFAATLVQGIGILIFVV